MPKKSLTTGQPAVHQELRGFDIRINAFGEIVTSLRVDTLNQFLDEKVVDKKLVDRDE